jgi:hypothetical protein
MVGRREVRMLKGEKAFVARVSNDVAPRDMT